MSYRVTGRTVKPDDVPSVKEELRYDEPDVPPPKAEPRQVKSEANPHFRFTLVSPTKGIYEEMGFTKFFPSKKAAKRVRNSLNKTFGSASYNIKKITLEEMMMDLPFMM